MNLVLGVKLNGIVKVWMSWSVQCAMCRVFIYFQIMSILKCSHGPSSVVLSHM